jgi:DNA-binding MarR family transcriptional regulator
MDIQKLSFQIEKLIQVLSSEESKYISTSKLKTLSSTQIHHIDLIYHERNPTLSELAKALKVTKPTVTNSIDKLEKLGLVFKIQSDDDRRIQHLHLTKKGMEISKLHDKFHSVFTEKLVSNLNDKEIKQLSAILEKTLKE